MYSQTNNETMKTVVETFVIEETQELIYDNEALDKWNDYISELGLTGQTQIVKKEKSPIPYLFINLPMQRVFETLCPVKVIISDYNKTPIPVEILSLVSMSKKEGHFNKVEIWYDDETPDPFCIGTIGKFHVISNQWSTVGKFDIEAEAKEFKESEGHYSVQFHETGRYLIGRWGDVKMSIEKLTDKAKSLFSARKKDEFNKQIMDGKRGLEDLEILTNQHFGYSQPSLPF